MEELGSILPKALQKHVRGGRKPVIEILAPLWPRVTGKFIGQFSRPIEFEDGRLTLAVASPSWETQLRAMAEPLRAQINSFLGAPVIKKLRIRPHTARDQAPGSFFASGQASRDCSQSAPFGRARVPPPSGEMASLLRAHGVFDLPPDVREVVERSFVKYFSRGAERNKA